MTRDDLTGLSLGPYALGKKIGGGGMGRVFTARHRRLDRLFAIKFIAADVATEADAAMRFDHEILALGKLQHSNIVDAVDAGCFDGLKYLVTELVDGFDLGQLVQRHGKLPIAEACELIRQAAVGLAYSHQCGYLHRDIKPSNLILDRTGVVKLLDYGLVRSAAAGPDLTQTGEWLGTLEFIAPEQAHDAANVDGRCDLYSLGCTLLYLVSGNVPFGAAKYATAAAKLKGHLFDQPQWLDDPPASVPRELLQILHRLLSKAPDDRYQTADEVVGALASLATGADVLSLFGTVPQVTHSTKSPIARARGGSLPAWDGRLALLLGVGLVASVGGWILSGLGRNDHTFVEVIEVIEPSEPVAPSPPDDVLAESAPEPLDESTGLPEPVPVSDRELVTQETSATVDAVPLSAPTPLSGMLRPRHGLGNHR